MPTKPMMPTAPDPRVPDLIRSAARARLVLLTLAIGVPGCLHGLLERQARRLDALGAYGQVTTATVTAVSGGGSIGYAYEVAGRRYTWSVAPSKVPSRAPSFPVVYLPADPSLNRPGTDRGVGFVEARSNRAFAWKLKAGVCYFFAAIALLNEVQLRRLRRTGVTEAGDPSGYKRRLALSGVLFAPLLALIVGWHALDAEQHGESLGPVVFGALLTLAILVGTWFYVSRDGVSGVAARSARLLKWIAPLALAVAALRAIAWFAGLR